VPGYDANIEAMGAIVQGDIDTLTKDIDGIVAGLHFYPSDDKCRISRTKYAGRSVEDPRIVRIGDGECALTFEGEMEAEHELSWMDWGYRGSNEEPEPWQREEWMIQRAGISGTAKVAIDRSKRLVKEVKWLELDSGEIEFHETPRRFCRLSARQVNAIVTRFLTTYPASSATSSIISARRLTLAIIGAPRRST
jgi:hypothetical protein